MPAAAALAAWWHKAPGPWVTGALLAALALAGCGGHGDTPPPPEPALYATVEGCPATAVHDSGHAVYLVQARDCPGGVRRVELTASRPGDPAPAPVVLNLGDSGETSIDIPGLGPRSVGLFRVGTWRMLPNTDSWSGRDGAGLLLLRGELYLLGGWAYGPTTNEVWKTRDLVHWERLADAPWPPRHGAGWLVHDDRLWVIGGDLLDDVWSSPDGVTWTQETAHGPFGPRYTPNAASLNGEIVVYAGQYWGPVEWCITRPDCFAAGPRDVWRSRDGRQWTRATAQAPWPGRGLIHGSIVHDGQIFLVGGGLKVTPPGERYAETSVEYTDIWSTRDGANWTQRLARFSFPPRTHFSVLSTPVGCFVSDGSVGTQVNASNELYVARDCIDFLPVPDTPPLQKRHASSLAWFNGSVVILGGPSNDAPGTVIWQYFP